MRGPHRSLPRWAALAALVAVAYQASSVSFDLDFHELCSVGACEPASVAALPTAAQGLLAPALLSVPALTRRRAA